MCAYMCVLTRACMCTYTRMCAYVYMKVQTNVCVCAYEFFRHNGVPAPELVVLELVRLMSIRREMSEINVVNENGVFLYYTIV